MGLISSLKPEPVGLQLVLGRGHHRNHPSAAVDADPAPSAVAVGVLLLHSRLPPLLPHPHLHQIMKLSSQQEKEDRHKNKEQVDMSIVVQPINLVHKWVLALEITTSLKIIRKIEIGCEIVCGVRVD